MNKTNFRLEKAIIYGETFKIFMDDEFIANLPFRSLLLMERDWIIDEANYRPEARLKRKELIQKLGNLNKTKGL